MTSQVGAIILGAMLSAFFTLLWRRLDSVESSIGKRIDGIDKTLVVIQADLKMFYGDQKELKGRVDEISHRVK